MTSGEFSAWLRAHIKEVYETQVEFATQHRISTAYLSDVLNGRKEPGPKLLAALGFTKHVTYERN